MRITGRLAAVAALACLCLNAIAQPPVSVWKTYHDYESLTARLRSLASTSPDLITLESLGRTTGGREVWMVTIGKNRSSGPENQPDKPVILLDGSMHGSEVVGGECVLDYIEYLVTSTDVKAKETLASCVTCAIPMVNPDGVEAGKTSAVWKAARENGTGVNLNRNFDWRWVTGRSASASSGDFRGPMAFSEVESRAVRDVITKLNPRIYLNAHSGTDDGPYLITPRSAPDEELYTTVADQIKMIGGYRRVRGTQGGESMQWAYWTAFEPQRKAGHHPLSLLLEIYTNSDIAVNSPNWWDRYNPKESELPGWKEKFRAIMIYLTKKARDL